MKLLLIFLLYGTLFPLPRDRKSCLSEVKRIVVKHWNFDLLTPMNIAPKQLESWAGSALYIKVYTDTCEINKFVQILEELPPAFLKEQDINTRSKLEVYGKWGVCYIYVDWWTVLIGEIKYQTTPPLREALKKLEVDSGKIEEGRGKAIVF